MTPTDPTPAIRSALVKHMPTAAIATGLVSPVDPSAWVSEISARIPYSARTDCPFGLTGLTGWLAARGITAGLGFIKALRLEWLRVEMVESTRRGE